jgi:cobalt-zinc-cadmium efflux system membrane fusion protein
MLGAMACLLVASCKSDEAASAVQQPTAGLKVETVHMQSIGNSLDLPGRVQADPANVVHIYTPLSGRLMNFSLIAGQEMRKGQTIGILESGDVAQARSDFEKAHIEVLRADRALDRGKLMLAHEVMSQADYQELVAADDSAHSEQERARQRIHELGFSENGNSDTTPITAPITGTVLDVGTANGEMQRSLETTTGLATVANLDTVWVTGDLFEKDLGKVRLHEPVEITFAAYPDETVHGTIANVSDALNPSTHAVQVRVVLANPGHRLKPDMFATLHIGLAAKTMILVPQAAVLHDGAQTVVYVPTADNKYAERPVQTGETRGDQVEIVSGLHDGQQVVAEGAAFLRQPAGAD